jgi:hypothetical protein
VLDRNVTTICGNNFLRYVVVWAAQERVLLYVVLNRGPKEDGGRDAKAFTVRRQMIRCGAGFLPSPLLMATPGTVKSFT